MMIKAIIIDDEQHCIDAILKLTEPYKNKITILGAFKTVNEGLLATKKLNPDLVFLDVEINDKTGFDYLEEVKNVDFHVVFTTAYDKYAVKAFKFSALHYLLKPIDVDDFLEILNRLNVDVSFRKVNQKIDAFLHNQRVRDSEKRITINTTRDCVILHVSDIVYCESTINYTTLVTKNNEKITSSKTLKKYEELLNSAGFYRVDQSYLVNLQYVKKYTKGKPAYAIMTNGIKIKVSLSKKEGFFKALNNLAAF